MAEGPATKPFPKIIYVSAVTNALYALHHTTRNSVIVMYLLDGLKLTVTESRQIFHCTYGLIGIATPLSGILSDSVLGNYKQIACFSIVAIFCGHVLFISSLTRNFSLAVTGIMLNVVYLALFIPCNTPLVGDQLDLPDQVDYLEDWFFLQYWVYNAAALVGSFMSPLLRRDLEMCDSENCFPACFLTSYVSISLAGVLFLAFYKFYVKKPPLQHRVLSTSFKALVHAVAMKRKTHVKREHWLDHADDKYPPRFLNDLKRLKVLRMLLPMLFIWALYSQEESLWIIQARHMNGDLGFYVIPPDQMTTLMYFFSLVLIPILNYWLYPLLGRKNILVTMLQRIATGSILFIISYVVGGILMYLSETYENPVPAAGNCNLRFYNPNHCTVELDVLQLKEVQIIKPMNYGYYQVSASGNDLASYNLTCGNSIKQSGNFTVEEGKNRGVFLKAQGKVVEFQDDVWRDERSNALVRVITNSDADFGYVIRRHHDRFGKTSGYNNLVELMPGIYEFHIEGMEDWSNATFHTFRVNQGAVYVLLVDKESDDYNIKLVKVMSEQELHMLWMVPQYFLSGIGEIMFGISGNQFVYMEAPLCMKSSVQAIWFVIRALGEVYILIAGSILPPDKLFIQFWTYASIGLLAIIIFIILSLRYEYVDQYQEF